MKINFYSTFREQAGEKTIELVSPNDASVRWVISKLMADYPGLKRHWLDKNGELHGHVHISVNQVDVMALPEKLDTPVGDEDVLDFFPPITGG